MAKPVNIVQKPETEVPAEVLADAIVAISQGVRKLRAGRLNDRALVLLIQHAAPSPINQRDVKSVLGAIDDLERQYIRKKP